jgi:EAL domain-containing protein (putative c-di-GMP-specific phosphodiesterase class I)/CheY-like chemotaxis protein
VRERAAGGDSGGRPLTDEGIFDFDQGLFADARILVVDDLEANVTLLQRILQSVGINNIVGLTDPREALDCCRTFGPDLVLLDLHMPAINGIELLLRMQADSPADSFLPKVVLTADVTAEAKKKALAAGANDFLTKPLDRTEVLLRVRNLLMTRALYSRVQQHNESLRRTLARQQDREQRSDRLRRFKSDRIRRVLECGGLSMVYQPVVDLKSEATVGYEALARFADPPYRPPNIWFGEADEVGLGPELELVAVELGLSAFATLGPTPFVSINISPGVAVTEPFIERFQAFPGDRVVVELTEHTRIDDYPASARALERLRSLGIRIAVDDAGAGYSSLQHILRLRPDIVKLDQGLIGSIDADAAKRALASSMVSFAKEIGAVLVAKGIETDEQRRVLRELGVEWGQGYLLGRPGTIPLSSDTVSSTIN